MGPTAAGKTALALELASRLPVEVINVDAAQVYRGMDIGTSKPTAEILDRVPHRLIDICSPWERYSAGRFRTDALIGINEILQNRRVPLLVGGTMFYFKALADGLSELPPASRQVADEIERAAARRGWPYLHQQLAVIDPEAANRISPNDAQRIQRLLQIHRFQGDRPSELMRNHRPDPLPFQIIQLALVRSDRKTLKAQIEKRFHIMLERGFLKEAETLYRAPQFSQSLPSMRSVGYRQAWRYLDGRISRTEMTDMVVTATCALAKRQITWIRGMSDVFWIAGDLTEPKDIVCSLIGEYSKAV